MACNRLNENLNYGKIPLPHRHKRENLHKHFNGKFKQLTNISNWENLDLNGTLVKTSHVNLFDPEIIILTRMEKKQVTEYYKKKDANFTLYSSYIVRDNHSGSVYLPQDCQVYSP